MGYRLGMKSLLVFSLISALWIPCLFAAEDGRIQQIRKWYAAIEGDKTFKKSIYKTGEEEEPHTVTLTRYVTKQGELRKLNFQAGGEHGFSSTTYYFMQGKLFFVYDSSEYWRFTGKRNAKDEPETIDIGYQYRYYFHQEKCIRALMKTAQTTDGDKLRALMKKAKNEPMVWHDSAPKVLAKAKALSKISSRDALSTYLSKP